MRYVLLNLERCQKEHASWWMPNGRGYTFDLTQAGRFTRAAAFDEERRSGGSDLAIPEQDAERYARGLRRPAPEKIGVGNYADAEVSF